VEDLLRVTIRAQLEAAREVMASLCADEVTIAVMEVVARRAADVLFAGGKLLFAGNGGSAADAQHLTAELVGRLTYDRRGLAALALTTDTSTLTAIGNDYGFERVFARQIEAVAHPGDLLIAMSTSGRSPNIIAALQAARSRGVITVGLTGRDGGAMAAWCDYLVAVPSSDTPRIQEGHQAVGHVICGLIERLCAPEKGEASDAGKD
jgi:D-sedoheptulose 7-phosphate isomerase